ncbi:DUF3040 domain-containing protein [Actinomycetospora sp.]|jgi:hypothetical protein|uniref:DUF3040 domain-containing protein n=1 Tax=Actinomycetospora sp. TaxID=1872135 RepID=UPI002F40090F
MLDDEERTVLEETERDLTRNDPHLVRRMQRGWGRSDGGRGRRVAVAVVTLALVVGLLWLGLPGQALLVVMVGIGFLVAFGWRPAGWVPAILRSDEDPPRS